MCILLGILGVPNEQMLEAVKEYLMKVWDLRKRNEHVRPVIVVNDYQYFGVSEIMDMALRS